MHSSLYIAHLSTISPRDNDVTTIDIQSAFVESTLGQSLLDSGSFHCLQSDISALFLTKPASLLAAVETQPQLAS